MKGAHYALRACLGRINRYTVERRVQVVLPYLNGDVLDIGCGSGRLADFVSKGQGYVGVAINEERIYLLKRKYMNYPNYEFWCIDMDKDITSDLPFLHSALDTIVLPAIIEHLRNPESLLRVLHRLLRNGMLLLITTPASVGDKISRLISMTALGTRASPYPHL